MYQNETHFLAQHERYEDLLREADRERLIRATRGRQSRRRRRHREAVSWMGRRLVEWGIRLQGHGIRPRSGESHIAGARMEVGGSGQTNAC